MAKSYAQLMEKQRFDDLMEFLDSEFQKLPDHRAGNATRYDLADVLKSAFAIVVFQIKCRNFSFLLMKSVSSVSLLPCRVHRSAIRHLI